MTVPPSGVAPPADRSLTVAVNVTDSPGDANAVEAVQRRERRQGTRWADCHRHGRRDLADHVVGRARDEQVARRINGDAEWAQFGVRRRSAVAAVAGRAVAGDGEDVAGRLDHLADSVVAVVGNKYVAHGVNGNAVVKIQLGVSRGSVVAAVTGDAVAGDGDDVACRLDYLADRGLAGVGDEEVARGVDGNGRWDHSARRRWPARRRHCNRRCRRQRR